MSEDDQPAGRTRFREPAGTVSVTKQAGRTSGRTRFAEPKTTPATAPKSRPKSTQETAEKSAPKPEPTDREAPVELEAPVVADPPARRGTALAVVATIVAVILLAGTIVFAVLYVRSRSDATELADTRTTVLRTAQKTAVDFSSYDYRHLDRDFAGVEAQLTPAFRKTYRSTAGALKATLSQYQAVGTAKVLDAGVATLSANKATVVVFLDQTVTSKTSKTPTVDRNRIRVSLERDGSRWLVSKLDVR